MSRFPTLNHKEVVKILENVGFVFERQKGSHKILKRANIGITVSCHNNRDMKRGTLKSIFRQADLSVEEVVRLIGERK